MKNKTRQEAQAALREIEKGIAFDKMHNGGKIKPNIGEKSALFKHSKTIRATLRTFINQSKPKEIAGDRAEALDLFDNPDEDDVEYWSTRASELHTIIQALTQPDDVGELVRLIDMFSTGSPESGVSYEDWVRKTCSEALANHTNKGDE